jgi:SAM-dependent methyltransferase
MHPSAMEAARIFFDKYKPTRIIEIGSYDLCGGPMKSVSPPGCTYLGVDLVAGNGVDRVMPDPYKVPAGSDSFDACVSTSTFEHVEFFWLTFLEMVRVVKPGGLIYINAPSNGPYHRHPTDCWRYYLDAGPALAKWANRNGYSVEVLETAIGEPDGGDPNGWKDWMCVWRRNS